MIPWGLLACILFAFAAGLVVGVFLKTWVDDADAEEAARREARKRALVYDWRDELGHEVTKPGPYRPAQDSTHSAAADWREELTARERYGQ